jgi:allantoicase
MSRLPIRNKFEMKYTNLTSWRLGAETLWCTDDFFARMENLLKPGRGIFIEDKFTDRGKWMDGWETRRRRFLPDGTTSDGLQHDHCTIKLGAQGVIRGVNIDTNNFLGNSPQFASVEACRAESDPDDETQWVELLPKSRIEQDQENLFDITVQEAEETVWTHIRLHIYPDGGVARFRVYGYVTPDWDQYLPNEVIDLAFIKNGARPLVCSDMFFSHMENLIMPSRGANMGDGWETKRRRFTGDPKQDHAHDWLILQLAARGTIQKALVDTHHFKGNFPDSVAIEGAVLTEAQAADLELLARESNDNALFEPASEETIEWVPLLDRTPLKAAREHQYKNEIRHTDRSFTHVRLKMYPDGGISRLRLWGEVTGNATDHA